MAMAADLGRKVRFMDLPSRNGEGLATVPEAEDEPVGSFPEGDATASSGGGGSFKPASEVFSPNDRRAKYRAPPQRATSAVAPAESTVTAPNTDDVLKRVSVVVFQHICRGEKVDPTFSEGLLVRHARSLSHLKSKASNRLRSIDAAAAAGRDGEGAGAGLHGAGFGSGTSSGSSTPLGDGARGISSVGGSSSSGGGGGLRGAMVSPFEDTPAPLGGVEVEATEDEQLFAEHHYVRPQWKYTFLRLPGPGLLTNFSVKRVDPSYRVPTVETIFHFLQSLYTGARLSPECSIVTLVYVERLMETQRIRLLSCNWRPILLCGMLLASKVWQDLSSWNVEFAAVFPQFAVSSVNRLERLFCHGIKWDLYISGSVYAKYYFALRSLGERRNFRQKYNYVVQVNPPNSKKLEERSKQAQSMLYSRSL